MTILGKKQMSEEDIKLNYITPVILDGWKGHVTMETKITDGRINISGNIVARSKPKFADYMLYLNDGKPIAVVEAKDNNHSVSHGLQQAMTYAQMMDLPFAYSSNGDAFYEHDFLTGQEQQIALEQFPTQEMLVARYYAELHSGKGISDMEKKINVVSITFPFDESENPKPVIIVGENGTGKTTLLSNVVDSLYELAEKAFNDVTKSDSGSGHQYFKAISPSEIQIGKEYMCSIIEYTCPRNPTYSIGYVMKCGSVSADLIKSGNSFCANKKVSWKDTEGYKKAFIEKSEAETIFGRSVFCYFGPDRYEKPAWMGKRYYQQDEDIHPSIRERWQGQLRKPITVHDVNEQTLQWLLDIIADSRCDIVQKGDQLLVEHIDMGSLLLQGTARRNVENIMTEILDKNVYFGLNYRNRGKSRFNICDTKNNSVLIPSLDSLSTGQSALFNIFATIVRYSEDNNINNSITLSQIEGVVIIDEVELHLHSNLQRNTLPKLMKLFPKVQFVITTHSPLFLLGLEEVYGANGFEIHEMPNGDCISAEAFSEFQKAYAFYSATKKHQAEIKDAINTHTAKPLVITEGATDWKHMKAAFSKLSQCPENVEAYRSLDFDFLEYEPEQSTKEGALKIQMSNTQLTSMCKHFASIPQPRKLIFIADADDTSTNKELGSESGFKVWGNNVYSFTIPVPAHRTDTPKICIEHYYSDNDIKTQVEINGVQRRIYMGNEFDSVGISVDGQLCCVDRNSCGPDKIRIIDGTSDKRVFCIQGDRKTNLALPKMEFADRVLGNSPEYSNIDFSSFSLIFDIINKICDQ